MTVKSAVRASLTPRGPGLPSFAGTTAEPANHSNLQIYNQAIPPSGAMLLDSGSFFFLLASASATTNVTISYNGPTEQFLGAPVGLQLQRIKTWKSLTITGTPGAVIQFIHGYSFTRQDYTNFQATIATISGAVSVTPAVGSTNTPTDHADVAVATGAVNATIPANALRKSLIIGSLSTNAPSTPANLRVQGHPGAAVAKGIELQPGTFIVLQTAAAVDVYNPDAQSQTYWWQEET